MQFAWLRGRDYTRVFRPRRLLVPGAGEERPIHASVVNDSTFARIGPAPSARFSDYPHDFTEVSA